MKIGIMQPYFFPYIGYWQLINAVDKYVIYDDVNYKKRGWINKNYILIGASANIINLRINKVSQNKLINELTVNHDENYKSELLKTIYLSYSKAPYYSVVFPLIEKIIRNDEENLANYLMFLLKEVCIYIGINTELILSSEIQKNNEFKGQFKIISICQGLSATQYINSIGGKDLYFTNDFSENGIDLNFIKTNYIEYKQFSNQDFIPNLSVIDVMMFNSPDEIRVMLDNYELLRG